MTNIVLVLLVVAFILVLVCAAGRCPLWVPVLLINIALLLPHADKLKL